MKRKLIVVALLLVTVAGAGAFYRSRSAEKPRFQTVAVTRGSIVDAVEATGTLESVDPVQIGSQVTGTIFTLGTDFNQQVRKGQVVATLDPALFQAQVDQAQATVTRLEADLERAKVQVVDANQKLLRAGALAKESLIPAQDLDAAQIVKDANGAALKSAEAQLVQARASLEQSKVNLGHTIIRAPDDGIVLSRAVELGQTVSASTQAPTLFIIARDLTAMRVNASVDESDIGRVKSGQEVRFTVDAYGQEVFTGKVSEVRLQPTVTSGVVSYPTMIEVPNMALKLKPGMTATVSIEMARQDDVLRLPVAALRFRPTPEQRGLTPGEMTQREGSGGGDVARDGGQRPDGAGAGASGAGAGTGAEATSAGRSGGGMPGVGTTVLAASAQNARGASSNDRSARGDGAGRRRGGRGGNGAGDPAATNAAGSGANGANGAAGSNGSNGSNGAAAASGTNGQNATSGANGARGGRGGRGENAAADPAAGGAAGGDAVEGRRGGVVWTLVNEKLTPVRVRVGLANATHVALLDGGLEEGAEVVTGVAQATTGAAPTTTNSPLMPNMQRRGPGGGGGGGGGPRRGGN